MGGKRKGKVKFRNAAEAQKARELKELWESKQKEWAGLSPLANKKVSVKSTKSFSPKIPDNRNTTKDIKSLNTWVTGAVNVKPTQHYTGTKMIGIGTLHKSNAVPVFTDDDAKDMAHMRR